MIDSLLVTLAIASVISVGLLFLPAIIELKKPQDAGPRLIAGFSCQDPSSNKITCLVNFEDGSK